MFSLDYFISSFLPNSCIPKHNQRRFAGRISLYLLAPTVNTEMSGVEIAPPSAVPLLDPEILATTVENPLLETDAALVVLEKILGYEFQNKDNLKLALTHTTSNPNKGPSKDSDRLETLLGDKFLGN